MSNDFKSGIQYFSKGVATIDVFFPEDKIRCQYCPFCRCESDLKRYWCRLTNDMIFNPYIDLLPDFCPIDFTGEIIGKRKER